MRFSRALPLFASCLLLAACGERVVTMNFSKAEVDDMTLVKDKDALKKVPGVTNVVTSHEAGGKATLEIYVEEPSQAKALEAAVNLGYEKRKLY